MNQEILLVICGSAAESDEFRITDGCNAVIGRATNCNICLAHPSVSRHHAMLVRDDGKMWIRDLGSTHGTFVDGKRVRLAEVEVGSSVRLGGVLLELLDEVCSRSGCDGDEDTPAPRVVHEPADAYLRASRFSPARRQVLEMLLHGHAEKQIAYQLDMSDNRVHRHVKGIYRAYGVQTRAQLSACFHDKLSTHVKLPTLPHFLPASSNPKVE